MQRESESESGEKFPGVALIFFWWRVCVFAWGTCGSAICFLVSRCFLWNSGEEGILGMKRAADVVRAGNRCRGAFFAVLYIINALPGMQKSLCFTFLFLILMFSRASAQQKSTGMNDYNYAKAWADVKGFEEKGLPESALAVVNTIYTHAKQEKNAAELVKR